MLNNNELVPTNDTLQRLSIMAKSAFNSKFYDKLGGEHGILSIMLLARELDIPPMQAIAGGIWNIQGKVEMSARTMNMKIRQAGHKLKIDSTTEYCKIIGVRNDTQEELSVTFSMDDAIRAGLTKNSTWAKYPREMLFSRCISILARMLFPDVIGNCYVEGEIKDAIDTKDDDDKKKKESGTKNTIEVEYTPINIDKPKEEKVNPQVTDINPSEEEAAQEEINNLPITHDQILQLEKLLFGKEDRMAKFLEHYKIKRLSELPQKHFDDAVAILKIKNKKEKVA